MKRVAFITDQHACRATRWEETLRIMDWCEAKFAELRPDAIAFGGDLFDRNPDVEEMRVVAEWIARLANIAPVVGVAGNHDPRGLKVFNLIKARHPVRFAEAPELHTVGGVEFALLPWPRKAQLLALFPDACKEEANQIGSAALLNVIRGLAETDSAWTHPRCFVGHVQLRGAKVSTGQPLAPGADFEIGLEDLALANCDGYLLGHIHLPDDATSGGAPASYGGSFRRTAYGEVEEKSIVVLDFDGDTCARSRIAIPCTPMLLLDSEFVLGGLMRPEAMPDVRGADIRFRYRVLANEQEAGMAEAERVRELLIADGAAEVKLEKVVIATGKARSVEVSRATTVGAKLLALWQARGDEPPAERAEKLVSMASELEVAS